MTLLLCLTVVLLLLFGAPLFVCVGALALGLMALVDMEQQVLIIELYRIASSPNLICIPLFALCGVVMSRSGMPRRFVALAQAALGWLPGASAVITLLTFEFFTAFTGASGLSILATGRLLQQVLQRAGYSERFSLGLITSAGSLGVLLPPSIVVVFYGTLTHTPIDLMFRAGLMPAAVMLAAVAAYAMVRSRAQVRQPFSGSALAAALKDARFELPLPLLVLGGIYGGLLTLNEAAALSAAYVIGVECFVYRDVHWRRELPGLALEAMTLVGAILVLLGVSLGLTSYAVDQGLTDVVVAWFTRNLDSQLGFLLTLNVLLLVAGCVLDVFSALILLVPLVAPLAEHYQVHPIHLGIIFLANLEIGYSTPPIGLNLFVASLTFKRPLSELIRAVLPFVLVLLLSVLVITFVPWLSLGLLPLEEP